jgi:ferredoxin
MNHSVDCQDSGDAATGGAAAASVGVGTGKARDTPRRIRLLVRLAIVAAIVTLLAGGATVWPRASLIVPALSPLVLICSALARFTAALHPSWGGAGPWSVLFSRAVLVGLPMLVLVLISRRWFCRCACPVGLATEPLRRLWPAAGRSARLPPVGRWIVWATLGGALLGCPLMLWLDPLAITSGALRVWHNPTGLAGWVAVIVLALVAIAAVRWPGAWCLRVCPLGATQELLAEGIQVAGRVTLALPVLPRALAKPEARGWPLPRRRALTLAAGALAVVAGAGAAWRARTAARGAAPKPLRPPGAAGEEQFPWLCTRCGNCVRACPAGILHPDQAPGTFFAFLTPIVRFDTSYCREDCRRCGEVCPSGAIAPLSLPQKQGWPMGLAQVDMTWCLCSPDNGERECAMCHNACPYDAIKLEFNYQTYVTTPRVDPQKCPGCGACEVACPGTDAAQRAAGPAGAPPRKAIFVVPPGEKRASS